MKDEAGRSEDYREVLWRIGRNLLLFQKAEHLLKAFLLHGKWEGSLERFDEGLARSRAGLEKQTLGQVAGGFMESIHRMPATPEAPGEISSVWLSFDYNIVLNEDATAARRDMLADLVRQRNDLVHGLLLRLNPACPENCRSVAAQLDSDDERFRLVVGELEGDFERLREMRRQILEFMSSEVGHEELVLGFLRGSALVQELARIAGEVTADEGWISLREASQDLEPGLVERELAACEQKSLTSLLAATRLFELKLMPTGTGPGRAYFRLLPAQQSSPPISSGIPTT